jgi:DUF1680 family protein
MNSTSKIETGGKEIEVVQETNYPVTGAVKISAKNSNGIKIAVRVPGWCKKYNMKATNAEETACENGYVVFECGENAQIEIEFDMEPTVVTANPLVRENTGKAAVMRGPVVYCAEGVDNGNVFSLLLSHNLNAEIKDSDLFKVPTLSVDGFDLLSDNCKVNGLYNNKYQEPVKTKIQLIPYFGFANRGESDMQVWMNLR